MLAWVEAKEMVVQPENQTWAHRCWQVQSWISRSNWPKGCGGRGCPHPPAWKLGHTHNVLGRGWGLCPFPSAMLSCEVKFCVLSYAGHNNLVILINLEVCKWLCYSNFVFSRRNALKIMETKCNRRCLSARATGFCRQGVPNPSVDPRLLLPSPSSLANVLPASPAQPSLRRTVSSGDVCSGVLFFVTGEHPFCKLVWYDHFMIPPLSERDFPSWRTLK